MTLRKNKYLEYKTGGDIMSYNHGTKHLSGQQQAIIRQREANDKLLKEESKKREAEKASQEENKLRLADLLEDIRKALVAFYEHNPNNKAKILFHPETLKYIKDNSPRPVAGDYTSYFGAPYQEDESIKEFSIIKD